MSENWYWLQYASLSKKRIKTKQWTFICNVCATRWLKIDIGYNTQVWAKKDLMLSSGHSLAMLRNPMPENWYWLQYASLRKKDLRLSSGHPLAMFVQTNVWKLILVTKLFLQMLKSWHWLSVQYCRM